MVWLEALKNLQKTNDHNIKAHSRDHSCRGKATNTELLKMIFGIIYNTLQMQTHVISFYGVTSMIRFMFLLFPHVSRN